MMIIQSKSNTLIKQIRKLSARSYRDKHGLYIAEGKRLCLEAIRYSADYISDVVMSETFYTDYGVKDEFSDLNISIVSDSLMSYISETENSQGVLMVMRKRKNELDMTEHKILLLDGLSDPGNMGTILRTALGFGYRTVLLYGNCVDVYNPKVVRSSMGAVFKLKSICVDIDVIRELKEYTVVASVIGSDSVDLSDLPIFDKLVLVIGNEAEGVSEQIIEAADVLTHIRISESCESLNAAIAAGIMMYKIKDREEYSCLKN